MIKKILLFVLISLACLAGASAQVSVVAYTNTSVAELDQEITLTIEVTGAGDAGMPSLPSMPNFSYYYNGFALDNVVADYNSTVVRQSKKIFTYTLIPRFTGKADIGPIRVRHLGKEYSTSPFFINIYRKGESPVNPNSAEPAYSTGRPPAPPAQPPALPKANTKPAAAPKPAAKPKEKKYDPIFIKAEVDKKSAYVGEQITLTIDFYNSLELLSAPIYTAPQISGMLQEHMEKDDGRPVPLGGKMYANAHMTTALFGALPGKGSVGKAAVNYEALRNIFDSQTFDQAIDALLTIGRSYRGSVSTDPITIEIKPLPSEGKGKDFYGAVGTKFSIQMTADRTELEAGEAATISLTIRGQGNLKTITEPALDIPDELRKYSVAGTSNTVPIKGKMQGSKTFRTVVVPMQSGDFVIGGIRFTYFDIDEKKYKTLTAPPVTLHVTPSKGGSGGVISFADGIPSGSGIQNVSRDINYIKEETVYKDNVLLRINRLGYFNIIPVLVAFAVLCIAAFSRSRAAVKGAFKNAYAGVKKAETTDGIAFAVAKYIYVKTGLSSSSMRKSEIRKSLEDKRGVSYETSKALEALWKDLDMCSFAPAEFQSRNITDFKAKALNVINNLEKELKQHEDK
ncbi:Oxygen tolerance [Parelusimicrobium proximum]|uniref:BatD family protein n=1 Tax=Parelusimicrobium proximum TaxID=3228953 RepID=UPI003D1725B6